MGYATRYRLEYAPQISVTETCPHCGGSGITRDDVIARALVEVVGCDGGSIGSNLDDPVKWYEHETDMKALSASYPEVLFTLRGEGEESGDVWVKYFKGGKMQISKAEIKLDEFDQSKLS